MRVAAGVGLVSALLGLSVASVALGAVSVPPAALLALLLGVGEPDPIHAAVVFDLRLPRLLLSSLVGASLATSGALLQGLFRNPLADPQLVGVSGGAALAAAAAVVLGGLPVPLAAFLGGLAVTAIVLGASARATTTSHLLLAGIGVNALCSAGVGILVFVADDAALRSFTFWTLGSVGGATWGAVGLAALAGGLPVALAVPLAGRLDAMLLGELDAAALGVPVAATRRLVVLLAASAVGVSVALCGMVGFVGLVAPHLVRLVAGPTHRVVLPGSALLGAVLVVGSDLAARTVAAPVEVPIGVVTTAVGGPFLLWLLSR